MMNTKAAPTMFGTYPSGCSSMSVTGDRTWESWKIPRITMRPSNQIAIETMVPSELPSAAPSTPGLCRTGIFTLTLATALLSTVAKIAVTTRMARAARTLSPSSARCRERTVRKLHASFTSCGGSRRLWDETLPCCRLSGEALPCPGPSDAALPSLGQGARPPFGRGAPGRSGPAEGQEILAAVPRPLEVREARAALEGPGHRLQQAMHGVQVPEMSGPQRGIEVHIARDVEGIRPGHGRHRGIGRRTGAAQIQQALVPGPERGGIGEQGGRLPLGQGPEEAGVVDGLGFEQLQQLLAEGADGRKMVGIAG